MSDKDEIMVATTDDLPGYEVVGVVGEIFGLIVRSRNVLKQFWCQLAQSCRRRIRRLHQIITRQP